MEKFYQEPLFILSYPRSGSSLLRSIINSHDNIVIPPECGFIQWLSPKNKNEVNINKFIKDLKKTKKIEGWQLNYEKLQSFLIKKDPKTYQELCCLVYIFYGESKGKKINIWGDKNNYYINHLDEISKLYPNANFVWIIRDPKDVISSQLNVLKIKGDYKYKPKFSANIEILAHEWVKSHNKIHKFLEGKNSYKVKYENLVNKTANEISSLFHFIGLNENNVLRNFNLKKYFDEPSITIHWKKNLLKEIDNSSINSYKTELNKPDIDTLNKILKKENITESAFFD